MTRQTSSTLLTILFLGILCVVAFSLRYPNTLNREYYTTDEVVYEFLGKQLLMDFPTYNTIRVAPHLAADLPDYFYQPLFKHPPVFSFLIAGNMTVLGTEISTAILTSLVMGVLTIPLVFFLTRSLLGTPLAVAASVLLTFDVAHTVCSQKAWMETTITFFTVLTAAAYYWGWSTKKNGWFYAFGIAAGLAVLTKYTGLLGWMAVMVYAGIWNREMYRNRAFLIGAAIPFVMLAGWGAWNIAIYGFGFLDTQLSMHEDTKLVRWRPAFFALLLLVADIIFILFRRARRGSARRPVMAKGIRWALWACGAAIAVLTVPGAIGALFSYTLPAKAWGGGLFHDAKPWFYFRKLMELNPLFMFGFAGMFLTARKDHAVRYATLMTLTVLGFFILWGNYQTRYVLQAVPFLCILSVYAIHSVYQLTSVPRSPVLRWGGKILLAAFVGICVSKQIFLLRYFAFPHDFSHF